MKELLAATEDAVEDALWSAIVRVDELAEGASHDARARDPG